MLDGTGPPWLVVPPPDEKQTNKQRTGQSEHQLLALPGKAVVHIEVHAPAHFLVDLRARSEARGRAKAADAGRGATSGGGGGDGQAGAEEDGGICRLMDFLATVQQVLC